MKITKTTLLQNYFLIGASGQKLWQFPVMKSFAYDSSQEPKKLTANYKGRCDDT